ncbi:MAG: GDP-mannose 4,6-dehydratase [Cyclobacteriaceae bacterium]
MNSKKRINILPQIGILQWFHLGEYEQVKNTIEDLKALNVKHLRTGISWADWYTKAGREWYDWLIPALAEQFEILPCFLFTPPSIGIEPKTSSPPKNVQDYADVMDVIITRYGEYFDYIELWNEPNNKSEWDFTLDVNWSKFAEMITRAAHWAQQRGKKTVLGGMSPIDASWLQLMFDYNLMDYIDVVGVHGFPDVFDSHWEGWKNNLERVEKVLQKNNSQPEIWITEAGYSTWQHDELKQMEKFMEILQAPATRIYWYSLHDLNPDRDTVDGFHLDDREYHFGLKKVDGKPKLLYRMWQSQGLKNIGNFYAKLNKITALPNQPYVLITGGAGFVGTNLAAFYLARGEKVVILDNLSRDGVENNVDWLQQNYGNNFRLLVADIRNPYVVKNAIFRASKVFHLAAQVAVTTSLNNPVEDFHINIEGTLNVLEAMRSMESPPPLIFTSTNKVYGNLQDIELSPNGKSYTPQMEQVQIKGIDETQGLNFYSPYGCSKGSADQYVQDYARMYNLPAVVFRMSCIYGPHQFGTEDQGWVAHFAIKALQNESITIYGDGKQVRDILFVDDLVNAFDLAIANMDSIKGEVFNIGGGTENAVSLLKVLDIYNQINWTSLNVNHEDWRVGDQKYYVSDITKFTAKTGWQPKIYYEKGIARLYHWLSEQPDIIKSNNIKVLEKEKIS